MRSGEHLLFSPLSSLTLRLADSCIPQVILTHSVNLVLHFRAWCTVVVQLMHYRDSAGDALHTEVVLVIHLQRWCMQLIRYGVHTLC